MKKLLILGLASLTLAGVASAQTPPPPQAGADAQTPRPPMEEGMDMTDDDTPPPPPPPGAERGDRRGPGGERGERGGRRGPGDGPGRHGPREMMMMSKAAHFRLDAGGVKLDVKCADDEPMQACADIAMKLLEQAGRPKP